MKTLERLRQIESHLAKTHDMVLAAMAAEESAKCPIRGRPDPDVTQRVAWKIARPEIWRRLQERPFTFRDVRKLLRADKYCSRCSNAAFSSILSNWKRDGYLKIVSPGSGPKPTVYEVKHK